MTGPEGQSLGEYRAGQIPEGPLTRLEQTRAGVTVRLEAVLPAWTATRGELPLLVLVLLCLALAVPGPKPEILDLELSREPSEVAGNLVVELDPQLRIQRVSRGVEKLGYRQSELAGSPISEFVERFHPAHQASVVEVARREGGRVDSVVTSTPVQNSAGDLEKIVVTLASPSSSEETELRARYRRMHKLCEAVCDNAQDCVVVVDAAASVVYANASFRRALAGQVDNGEALLPRLRATDRIAFTDALQGAFEGQPSRLTEFSVDGPSSVLLEGGFHALSGGNVLAVGLFRDVTEARRLAQELERTRERAGHTQKIEALGRMAGGVAHDFNNLLASLMLGLASVKASMEPDSAALPHLREMDLVVEKASSITRQLLLYSRKKPNQTQRVSCHRAIEDAVRMTEGLLAGVRLETQLEARQDHVLLEEGQLDQVLLNLLLNARDALGEDGRIQVLTSNPRTDRPGLAGGSYLSLQVRDNGCGIPRELQARVLEPYFTTKPVGKGTGLGLSTAAAVEEKAGGQIWLTSRPGETTFTICLPLAAEQPLPAEPSLAAAPPRENGPSAGQSVLLVEDETVIRALLQRILEKRGFRVTSASNGSDAAALLQDQNAFDLLITDLVLPGVSGPELALAFQRNRPGGPVLFMSGFPGDTLEDRDLAAHSRFLAKPFSPEQLMASLSQLLEGRP